MPALYPIAAADRDRWILERRQERNQLDPFAPYAYLVEDECTVDLRVVQVATIFLTNRECPWRCVMCDLWRNTLADSVPSGAIPRQIEFALARLPKASHVKLYNSGSFFDPRAIPVADYGDIAMLLRVFDRVVVESHPALLGENCMRFRDMLSGSLEVAMGLETAHPETLSKLNKRMTLDQFSEAAAWLRTNEIAMRAFVLVKPPFMLEDEVDYWSARSIDFAFDSGASAVSLIPTRGGNGAIDALRRDGDFAPPSLGMLEQALSYGLQLQRGRVFADSWDLEQFRDCDYCFDSRRARLKRLNLTQQFTPPVPCAYCGGGR